MQHVTTWLHVEHQALTHSNDNDNDSPVELSAASHSRSARQFIKDDIRDGEGVASVWTDNFEMKLSIQSTISKQHEHTYMSLIIC